MNVLVEGIGSMVFNTQLKYYNELNWNIIGIDIQKYSYGLYTVPKSYIVSKYFEKNCFEVLEDIIFKETIDLVFPTVNEGLLEWSKRKKYFHEKFGTNIIISDEKVISICMDKWNTYNFFIKNNIPTPKTSLFLKYNLVKPRIGRGSSGIFTKDNVPANFSMEGYISQELVNGEEYTIDILCDFDAKPIYIIPRKRLETESGVSIKGVTVYDKEIIDYTEKIVEALKPIGILNIQCFKDNDKIWFIEINPRIGGGCTLSFASSDNWFKVIDKLLKGEEYKKKDIIYNNYMMRYYEEVIVNGKDLIN